MKISREQFEKAVGYALRTREKEKNRNPKVSENELKLLIEVLKNMPEEAIRHLDYAKTREAIEKVSEQDLAEKMLLRKIVDKLLNNSE